MLNFRPFSTLTPKPKAVVTTDIQEDTFNFIHQFMYNYDSACEYVFDREYKEINGKIDKNELMAEVIQQMLTKHIRTRDTLNAANYRFMERIERLERLNKRKNKNRGQAALRSDLPQLWLLTFTLAPNDEPSKVLKRMINSMKKYKYMYVEEHGGQNGRYHIHVIAETNDKRGFEQGYNLKPTNDHQGKIDRKRYLYNNDSNAKYLDKETPVKGDVEYIRNLIKKLPKSKNN